jgi:branched-chain amino acid transport system substrate-binding protein
VKPIRAKALLAAFAALACLSGCGAGAPVSGRIRGTTLTIYYSGPTHGASSLGSQAALNGARIALAGIQGRIGKYRILLRALDDSTPQSDGWDPNQTTTNARLAVQDPTTVGYLGDFNSGAAAISIPLLNREGIAQLGPAASAVGLTSTGPGASPGEPEKYDPTGVRTFARPVPNDAVQALSQVRLAQSSGCRRMFVLHDGEVDGEDEGLSFVLTAQSAALRVVGVQVFQRSAPDYTPLALSVAQAGADCVLLSAIDEGSAARLAAALARALPHAPIIASSGLADSAFTDPADGGLPLADGARVEVTSPTLGARAYPASGQAFLAAYSRQFGPPEPPAIFGYEAMSLILRAIERATDHGRKAAVRSKVVEAVFATRKRRSVVGTYSVDASGDTTLRRYGIYRIVAGRLSFWRLSG